jgi:uncharacterized membrane protein
MRSCLTSEDVSDEVLTERVRSRLGGLISHPSALEVNAEQGHVTLRGPVLRDEASRLLKGVAAVRGVRDVNDQLAVQDEHGNVSALPGQPAHKLSGQQWDVMQRHWSPTTRLLIGAAGGAMATYGAGRRDTFGGAIGFAGMSMLMRALTNIELKRVLGVGVGKRAVDIRKTISIDAPVERVFALWANYQSFPRFMSHVRQVQDLGNGRSHWTVTGPAGTTVEWDAVITSYIPQEVLAWQTEPNSIVQHTGRVRFRPHVDGSTTVNVHLSYNPAVGGLGHVVASLFGTDPKRQMDDDLLRMKTFLETRKAPSDAT